MALKQFEVIGVMPIRDAVTKESVHKGGIVTLDDQEVERPRHAGATPLAPTIISALIESGCIRPVDEKPKKDK